MGSKFVKEIIKDIKENPETYKDYGGSGVEKENIIIYNYGNTRFLSVIKVVIHGKTIPTTYIDNWMLEVTIKKWYKNLTLAMLLV